MAGPAGAGGPPAPTPEQRAVFQQMGLVALVLVSWEILVHLPQDIRYLRSKGWWKRPVLWAYFLQRYSALMVNTAQVNIRFGHFTNCYAWSMVSLTLGGVVVLPCVSLIYLYRVLAIWNRRPAVKYTLIVMWVIVLGASITAPFSQEARSTPNGGCTVTRNERYTPASFIANACFDLLVFILTVWKLAANRHQYKKFRSPIQATLLRDGVLYFAVVVIIGIVDISFILSMKLPVVASTVIPLHIALTSIMTTRLVNNVFHIVDAGQGPIYMSDDQTANASHPRPPNYSRGTAGSGTIMVIGSGVGTEYFDKSGNSNGMESFAYSTGLEKEGQEHRGNAAIPLQLRVTTETSRV
ncbi:hypothetical protein BKA70DRAFT_1301011 [Coprinopsis sp. MPI-PUGE-AT-0042]|nr:hypothetical protein BKA70DRAFT_1301011 [Coprinopsis sp. MPI-PUGE-AT-0042]